MTQEVLVKINLKASRVSSLDQKLLYCLLSQNPNVSEFKCGQKYIVKVDNSGQASILLSHTIDRSREAGGEVFRVRDHKADSPRSVLGKGAYARVKLSRYYFILNDPEKTAEPVAGNAACKIEKPNAEGKVLQQWQHDVMNEAVLTTTVNPSSTYSMTVLLTAEAARGSKLTANSYPAESEHPWAAEFYGTTKPADYGIKRAPKNKSVFYQPFHQAGDMRGWMKQDLKFGEVLNLFIKILYAAQKVWQAGFVHRDLKLQNIFFDPVLGKVTIGDFGLARKQGYPLERLFKKGKDVAGAIPYSAPELFDGSRADEKTEIYSLGRVAAIMFGATQMESYHHVPPFYKSQKVTPHIQITEIEDNHLQGLFANFKIPMAAQKELRSFLKRMMHSSRHERPSFAESLKFFNNFLLQNCSELYLEVTKSIASISSLLSCSKNKFPAPDDIKLKIPVKRL